MTRPRGGPESPERRRLLVRAAGLAGAAALSRGARARVDGASWRVFETARDNGHRLAPLPAPPRAAGSSLPAIRCRPERRMQSILGFGGALTESAAHVLARLSDAGRRAVLRAYYDPMHGIGYTLARTPMTSCDFSLSSWTCDDVAGDAGLEHFSLAPMRRYQLPLIRDARRIAGASRFRLLASPWSPPAWMKTNGEMPHGGRLRSDCAAAWAAYFVRFARAMRDENEPLWAVTVQNEPDATQVWESCLYSPTQEADFIARHLGPALERARLGVQLFGWDHNRDGLVERAEALLGDPDCARHLAGIAIHWYGEELFGASRVVRDRFPGTRILMTEGCVEGGPHVDDWSAAERYARNMIGDFGNGVCGYIDWNIALDMRGGPNHVGNFCHAPVLVDTDAGRAHFQPSFHYIGHFSRFVRPGARRVGLENQSGLGAVAFVNSDASLVAVVANASDAEAAFVLGAGADERRCRIPAHAIQTHIIGA